MDRTILIGVLVVEFAVIALLFYYRAETFDWEWQEQAALPNVPGACLMAAIKDCTTHCYATHNVSTASGPYSEGGDHDRRSAFSRAHQDSTRCITLCMKQVSAYCREEVKRLANEEGLEYTDAVCTKCEDNKAHECGIKGIIPRIFGCTSMKRF